MVGEKTDTIGLWACLAFCRKCFSPNNQSLAKKNIGIKNSFHFLCIAVTHIEHIVCTFKITWKKVCSKWMFMDSCLLESTTVHHIYPFSFCCEFNWFVQSFSSLVVLFYFIHIHIFSVRFYASFLLLVVLTLVCVFIYFPCTNTVALILFVIFIMSGNFRI